MADGIVRIGSLVHATARNGVQLEPLQTLLGSSPFGMCVFERDLRYLLINDALADMNGVPAEDHIGRTVREIVPSLEAEARRVAESIFSTGKPMLNQEFCGETPRLPGVERNWNESWYPIFVQGEVDSIGVVVEEITERRNLERQLRASVEQKDRFIAFLSHELRNSLGPAATAVKVMRMPTSDDLRARMLDLADRNLEQLARLLDDLLDASRLTRGMLVLQRQVLDLCAVTRLNCDSFRLNAESKSVKLHVELPSGPVLASIDEVRIAQVLSNLLVNALNHARYQHGEIHVRLIADDTRAVIEVMDNGVGINAEDLPRLFEPFYTTSTGGKSSGGLGIGLSVAKSIVEAHGGSITARSEGAGKGATFALSLPLAELTRA